MLDLNKYFSAFCDKEISPYEKTIYTLAMAYAESPIFDVKPEMINELADLLNVDVDILKSELSEQKNIGYGDVIITLSEETIDCTDYFKNTFFASIIKLHLAYKELNKISDKIDEDTIIENIKHMQSAIFFFDSVNANNATYECMLERRFSYKHTVYDSGDFPPMDYVKMLRMLVISDDCLKYDKSLLSIISHLAQYELRTRLNALYLIMITQIIMHSPFFEEEIHKMSLEMYEHLMFILKNGRIISIQVNSLYFDSAKNYEVRTKQDNTTRLQILYGYENFDTYVMRVDLSHQGQPFIHFNNASPGKVCSYLFTKKEYEDTISRYPLLKSCFVEYNNYRWALKERNNCELTKEVVDMFDTVESEKAHKGVFSEHFSEERVVEFIDCFSNMLPSTCHIPIDKDGEYARRCFNYDILIRNASWLYLAYISKDAKSVELLMEDILTKATNYGLLADDEQIERNSLFEIYYILCSAKDKANITL